METLTGSPVDVDDAGMTTVEDKNKGPLSRMDWLDSLTWAGFALVALGFLALKSFAFHWQVGDENVYFYMAWATAEHGALPYGDYFFAHPPLHLLPGVGLFALFGFGPVTGRLLPILASLLGAFFLFRLVWGRAGRVSALLTVLFYLGAFSLLRASSHWTGINLSVMWICVGLWALLGLKTRPLLAGLFFALGVGTGNYVLPAAVMAALLVLLRDPKEALRFLAGFIVPWLAIQVLGLALGGGAYWEGVYLYHFLKPVKEGVSRNMFVRVFGDNFILFLGLLLSPVMAWLDGRLSKGSGLVSPTGDTTGEGAIWHRVWRWARLQLWQEEVLSLMRVGAMWSLGYIFFIASLPRVFPFYFLLFFPAMACCAGLVVTRGGQHVAGLVRCRGKRDKTWWETIVLLAVLVLFVALAGAVRVPLQRALLPKYVRSMDKPMRWSDSPLPMINSLFRACCWDDVAEAYQAYGTVQEVLYHESRYFGVAEELAVHVREHSRPEHTLYGDSSTAGLVALLAGRRLAGDEADSNTMRFTTGITPAEKLISEIDQADLKFVLVSGRVLRSRDGQVRWRFGKFARLPAFAGWLRREFKFVRQVQDRTKGWYSLLERK